MRPALLQERGIKMTTTNRTSRTRRKRNTGTLNVKCEPCLKKLSEKIAKQLQNEGD